MSTRSLGRVRKTLAQKIIILTGELNLSSEKLKIKCFRNFVYVPPASRPSRPKLEFLSRASGAKVSTYVFQEKPTGTMSLADVLEGKLAPRFMAFFARSLDIVGKIAVVEVPQELRPLRAVLGDGILTLNKNVKTVLAKQGAVSGTYRLRRMEVITGKLDTTRFTGSKDVSFTWILTRRTFRRGSHSSITGWLHKPEKVKLYWTCLLAPDLLQCRSQRCIRM